VDFIQCFSANFLSGSSMIEFFLIITNVSVYQMKKCLLIYFFHHEYIGSFSCMTFPLKLANISLKNKILMEKI
jgi:hypothetical protein